MQNIVVTGANRGIGLALCKQFQHRGDKVIALCRRSSTELDELGIRVYSDIDVSSQDQVSTLLTKIDNQSIDILVNCAGILESNALASLDFNSIRRQFEVNSIGPLLVTSTLLPKLKEGSKVVIITSRMGSIADNDSGGQYGYRMSKTAVNIAGVSLAVDLKPKGIAVALLHPGYVKTEMTGGNGLVDTAQSAAGLIARIGEMSIANTGSFWHMNGEELPW